MIVSKDVVILLGKVEDIFYWNLLLLLWFIGCGIMLI